MARKHFNPMASHMDRTEGARRPKNSDLRDISFTTVIQETEKAYLLLIEGEEVWLPKSQVEVHEGDQVVVCPNWLCEEKGL